MAKFAPCLPHRKARGKPVSCRFNGVWQQGMISAWYMPLFTPLVPNQALVEAGNSADCAIWVCGEHVSRLGRSIFLATTHYQPWDGAMNTCLILAPWPENAPPQPKYNPAPWFSGVLGVARLPHRSMRGTIIVSSTTARHLRARTCARTFEQRSVNGIPQLLLAV